MFGFCQALNRESYFPIHQCFESLFRPTHWASFIVQLRFLGENSSALRHSETLTPEVLLQLTSHTHVVLPQCRTRTSSLPKFHAIMGFGSLASSASLCQGPDRSALWLPLDLLLEDAMDGYQVDAASEIERITGEVGFFLPLLKNILTKWFRSWLLQKQFL